MKDRDEINRFIHVEIIGECWHEISSLDVEKLDDNRGFFHCVHCKEKCHCQYDLDHPDYCSDNSPRRLLNEVVAKLLENDADGSVERALDRKMVFARSRNAETDPRWSCA